MQLAFETAVRLELPAKRLVTPCDVELLPDRGRDEVPASKIRKRRFYALSEARYLLDLNRSRRRSGLAAIPTPNRDRDGVVVRARRVRHEVD